MAVMVSPSSTQHAGRQFYVEGKTIEPRRSPVAVGKDIMDFIVNKFYHEMTDELDAGESVAASQKRTARYRLLLFKTKNLLKL